MELIKAKKSLGQNFLVDKNICKKIVALLEIEKGDYVIEIGPGTGALSEHLINKSINYLAIEVDERAIDNLKSNFPLFNNDSSGNVSLIKEDFLKFDLYNYIIKNEIVEKNKKLKIIGNIPYNISSPIFFKLFELSEYIDSVVIMVQLELANRIIAKHNSKDFGILTLAAGVCGIAKKELKVPRTCFVPAPNVDSAVLRIDFYKKKKVDFSKFQKISRAAFNQRRKKLSNSLKNILLSYSKELYDELIKENKNGFFDKRPEQLSIEEFIELYQYISTKINNYNKSKNK